MTAASADQVITQNSTRVMKEKEEGDERGEDDRKEDVSRVISVYYKFGLVFISLAIVSISNNNTVLPRVIAGIWEHSNITKK